MVAVLVLITLLAIYIIIMVVEIVSNHKLRKELNKYNSLLAEQNAILRKSIDITTKAEE